MDKNVTFLYQGYSITEEHNLTGLSFQSIYKKITWKATFICVLETSPIKLKKQTYIVILFYQMKFNKI